MLRAHTSFRVLARGTLAVAAVAILCAGCGAGGGHPRSGGSSIPSASPTVTASAAAAAHPCLNAAERRSEIRFAGPDGARLAGVVVGHGRVGIVLAHQSPGSLCDWWPYARRLARAGYRVLAFDFEGYGASTGGKSRYPRDVVAAAGWLRAHHTPTVVLMGASMGGTAVVVAAARLTPPPAGVVDLSGPDVFAGMNSTAAARHVDVPMLFAVGRQDTAFYSGIKRVYRDAAASHERLVTAPDNAHGASLVEPNLGWRKIRVAVRRFLASVRKPGGS